MIAGAEQLIARGAGVRAFAHERRPGFADTAPSGRMRLDAIACWLQDVAYADVEDAQLYDVAVWVVRRTRIRVHRFPRFGERFTVTTFCSGLGRMWAERRTDIRRVGDDDADPETPADVEAVSLWVHLEPGTWRPSPLTAAEIETYSGAESSRQVTARLQHPSALPENGYGSGMWTFRETERDIADHINNAAYWTVLEDELLRGAEPDRLDAEIEYRAPAQPGPKQVLSDGPRRWLVGPDDELHATFLVRGRDDEVGG